MKLNAYVIREFLEGPVLWDSIGEDLTGMPYENADLYEEGLSLETDTVYVISPADFLQNYTAFSCGAYVVAGPCHQETAGYGVSVICVDSTEKPQEAP